MYLLFVQQLEPVLFIYAAKRMVSSSIALKMTQRGGGGVDGEGRGGVDGEGRGGGLTGRGGGGG